MVCTHRESVRSEVFNRIIEPSEIFSLTCDMNDVDGPVVSFSKKAKNRDYCGVQDESSIYPMSADGYLTISLLINSLILLIFNSYKVILTLVFILFLCFLYDKYMRNIYITLLVST
jgi:hypothetical protein